MKTTESSIPSNSLVAYYLARVDYNDSYVVGLTDIELDIREIYLAIFSFSPLWVKQLFYIRNKIVGIFGIKGPSTKGLFNIERKPQYEVGEKIGLFPMYSLELNELIVGVDDKHLNFRMSVQKISHGESYSVVVTTIVQFNNIFGRLYLFCIKPMHKYIVKRLLSDAFEKKAR